MICDYCATDTLITYRVFDEHGNAEQVCINCKHDVDYCAAGGRIAQNPGDEPGVDR